MINPCTYDANIKSSEASASKLLNPEVYFSVVGVVFVVGSLAMLIIAALAQTNVVPGGTKLSYCLFAAGGTGIAGGTGMLISAVQDLRHKQKLPSPQLPVSSLTGCTET